VAGSEARARPKNKSGKWLVIRHTWGEDARGTEGASGGVTKMYGRSLLELKGSTGVIPDHEKLRNRKNENLLLCRAVVREVGG